MLPPKAVREQLAKRVLPHTPLRKLSLALFYIFSLDILGVLTWDEQHGHVGRAELA